MSQQPNQTPKKFSYEDCSYSLVVKNKGLLTDNSRYIYLKEGLIIVCKQPFEQVPYKQYKIEGNWLLKWIYQEKKENEAQEQVVIGFKLYERTGTKLMEYYGEGASLVQLRYHVQKQLFQVDFLRDFDIIEKIGSGKYAKVYKVQNKFTKEFCAVKYLNKKKLAEIEDGVDALFNELKILRTINNKYCIQFIAAYEDKNGYYILTELLDHNKSLQNELTKFKDLNFDLRVSKLITKQLLLAIEYVHSQGIMHRDLKPQNIMFTLDNKDSLSHLKVIDFGLAQFYQDPNFLYVHVGTPGFVAPEILANESESHRYGPKCDIFSIGIIFHILLTGKQVFPGKKFKQVLEKNKLCNIQLTGQEYEKISKDSMDLLQKLLETDVKKRLTATEALQHPFFCESDSQVFRKRMPSMQAADATEYLQQQQQAGGRDESDQKPRKLSNYVHPREVPDNLSQEIAQKNMLIKIFYQLIKFLIQYYEYQKVQSVSEAKNIELPNQQKRNRKFSIEDNYDELESPNDINFIRQFAKMSVNSELVKQPQQLEYVRKLSFQSINQKAHQNNKDLQKIMQQINEQSPTGTKKLLQNTMSPESVSLENQLGKSQNCEFTQPPAKVINDEEVAGDSQTALKGGSPCQEQTKQKKEEESKYGDFDGFEMVVDNKQETQTAEHRDSNLVMSPVVQAKKKEEEEAEQKQVTLTKNWHQLYTVFPVESFLSLPNIDDVIYNIALYLLFGYDLHKCKELQDSTIQSQLKEVAQSKIFDDWFIQLIQEMILKKQKKSDLTLDDIEKRVGTYIVQTLGVKQSTNDQLDNAKK